MTDKRITSHSHLAAGSTSQLAVASPRMHRAGELLNGIGKKMVPSFLRKKNERDKDEEAEEDDNSEPPSRAITRVPTVEVEDEQKSTSNPGVHSEQKRSHSIRSTGSTDSSRRKSKAKSQDVSGELTDTDSEYSGDSDSSLSRQAARREQLKEKIEAYEQYRRMTETKLASVLSARDALLAARDNGMDQSSSPRAMSKENKKKVQQYESKVKSYRKRLGRVDKHLQEYRRELRYLKGDVLERKGSSADVESRTLLARAVEGGGAAVHAGFKVFKDLGTRRRHTSTAEETLDTEHKSKDKSSAEKEADAEAEGDGSSASSCRPLDVLSEEQKAEIKNMATSLARLSSERTELQKTVHRLRDEIRERDTHLENLRSFMLKLVDSLNKDVDARQRSVQERIETNDTSLKELTQALTVVEGKFQAMLQKMEGCQTAYENVHKQAQRIEGIAMTPETMTLSLQQVREFSSKSSVNAAITAVSTLCAVMLMLKALLYIASLLGSSATFLLSFFMSFREN
eukprot:m.234032 g.234032  ORF g.234032 m.234032 type:complete len:513 (-) comp22465_c1_seq8:21-1559(-)